MNSTFHAGFHGDHQAVCLFSLFALLKYILESLFSYYKTNEKRDKWALITQLRPDPNAAPLMCRTKLNKVRLRSDFGATADSYGVPAPNLIREACGKQFSMRKYAL